MTQRIHDIAVINGRPTDLNAFCRLVHQFNEKWWRDLDTGEAITRNRANLRMLMVSETAEAMEGARKNLMDDKLPHRKMIEVELADTIIRVADYTGGFKEALLDFTTEWRDQMRFPWAKYTPDADKGEMLLEIVKSIVKVDEYCFGDTTGRQLSRLLWDIEQLASILGLDLWGAVWEKLEYNRTRADHQVEARKAANGKKW